MKLVTLQGVVVTSMFLALALPMVLSGYVSIIHGSRQTVSFDSAPPGTIVKLQNGTSFTTPHTTELRRAEDHNVTIEKDGPLPPFRETFFGFFRASLWMASSAGLGLSS